jgi:hypothetical protein
MEKSKAVDQSRLTDLRSVKELCLGWRPAPQTLLREVPELSIFSCFLKKETSTRRGGMRRVQTKEACRSA